MSGIPTLLAGNWSQGSVGGEVLTTEGWLPSGSSGFLYRFGADGTYEFSGTMSSIGMSVSSYERGDATVNGNQLTLRPVEARVRQPDGTITTDLPPAKTYLWQVGQDAIGSVVLQLTFPDGQVDYFYR